jgi:hypothetical protein
MTLEIPKTSYTGNIKEIILGKGDKAAVVGGRHLILFTFSKVRCPTNP